MTPAELKAEIETGPLAAALAAPWADTFPAEPEPPDTNPKSPMRLRWERIRTRFGTLTPDAVHDLLKVLTDPTRRTRANEFMSRGAFLAAISVFVIPLMSAPEAVRTKWGMLLNLATGGDADVRIARPELQGLFDLALADGLIDQTQRASFTSAGVVPCSRLDELGWTVTAADLQNAKAVQ